VQEVQYLLAQLHGLMDAAHDNIYFTAVYFHSWLFLDIVAWYLMTMQESAVKLNCLVGF